MGLQQTTARDILEVMEWIETHAHHIATCEPLDAEKPTHFVLKGHRHVLRVPIAVWRQCDTMPSPDPFDTRMYRWDHTAAGRRRRNAAVGKLPNEVE